MSWKRMRHIHNKYTRELKESIRKAIKEGWIEDFDDPWVDLPCFTSYDIVNCRCEDCPLGPLCEEERDRGIMVYH